MLAGALTAGHCRSTNLSEVRFDPEDKPGVSNVLSIPGADGWLLGAGLGFLHGVFVSTALVNILLPFVHPRMGTSFTATGSSPLLEAPGFLMRNYGGTTPAVSIVAHTVYGAIVGGFVSLH